MSESATALSRLTGAQILVEFLVRQGVPFAAGIQAIGAAFGIHSEAATHPDAVAPAVRRALASGGPSLVHAKVDRDLAVAGADKTGWWDAPSPPNHPEQHARWRAGRAEEQHQ